MAKIPGESFQVDFSVTAADQNKSLEQITQRESKDSVNLLQCLSLPSSPSFSSPLLNGIGLDLQCHTDNADNDPAQKLHLCRPDLKLNAGETKERPSSAEVYMLSNISLNNASMFVKARVNYTNARLKADFEKPANILNIEENFLHKSHVDTDVKDHPSSTNVNFATGILCNLCNVQFSSDQALDAHFKDKHTVKEECSYFICSVCDEFFDNDQSLEKHEKTHSKNLTMPNPVDNQCETSKNSYTSCSPVSVSEREHLFKDYIAIKSNKERKVFSCSRCPFSCLKPQTMTLHIQRHEEEPKFACDQCGKLYLTMSVLKRHANTHNKTRLYSCKIPNCGKSFNMKGRLTDHVRTVHRLKTTTKKAKKKRQITFSPQVSSQGNQNDHLDSEDIVVYDVILPENEIEHFKTPNTSSKPHYLDVSHRCDPFKSEEDPKREENITQNSEKKQDSTALHTILEADDKECVNYDPSKKRNFVCSWVNCGRKFRDNYNLRMHMCTHTGEMQRACTMSRYRCVQQSALDSHMAKHRKQSRKQQ